MKEKLTQQLIKLTFEKNLEKPEYIMHPNSEECKTFILSNKLTNEEFKKLVNHCIGMSYLKPFTAHPHCFIITEKGKEFAQETKVIRISNFFQKRAGIIAIIAVLISVISLLISLYQ